ncbi:MAG: methylenetetrahydrofolate--tRNA-(uracil(54)-C(5))-methyltransferase (FADH(2)-oxidizing) TrmFO, partial [Deltaproteobacteria bacterium]|nr:methylenetetrahydrofolate--tRNA-(uracil(54)-C(5))-methyltransferase (FADH(2)-oxidizing) TrmFO [Deltaproteobacteria bacterium]
MNYKGHIAVVGGGLAGTECAYFLSKSGILTDLYEMKPLRFSEAHRSEKLAELVCSNSLKSKNPYNPQGLLKEEMKRFGSLIIEAAENTSVPAGDSLSVDREMFSDYITGKISSLGNINIIRDEVLNPEALLNKYDAVVIATGPLTSQSLAASFRKMIGGTDLLYFYDAVSPVVTSDSIDMEKAFLGSRYGKGGDDYINCPLSEDEYKKLYEAIIGAELVNSHIDENLRFFEGCLPVEEIARRGFKSLSFGPFKPVGLGFEKINMPYAVVQLRAENRKKTLYSVVAFQTRMKYSSQEHVLRLIPALRNCEIVRYGQMHRNVYINSPEVMNENLSLKNNSKVFVSGTLLGVEGYTEAAQSGIIVAIAVISFLMGREFNPPPDMTAMGLLYRYIRGEISAGREFVPTNINKGLFLHNGAKRYSEKMAEDAVRMIEEYV